MRQFTFFLVALFLSACTVHTPEAAAQIAIDPRDPPTPSQDSLRKWSTILDSVLTRYPKTDSVPYSTFRMNEALFSGWTQLRHKEGEHAVRYTQYTDGISTWQIDFYANGNRAADFRFEEGKEFGCIRMWYMDGSSYINTFYSGSGEMDGLQWRWYKNGAVARKALFDNGNLVYELLYDEQGVVTSQEGSVPE